MPFDAAYFVVINYKVYRKRKKKSFRNIINFPVIIRISFVCGDFSSGPFRRLRHMRWNPSEQSRWREAAARLSSWWVLWSRWDAGFCLENDIINDECQNCTHFSFHSSTHLLWESEEEPQLHAVPIASIHLAFHIPASPSLASLWVCMSVAVARQIGPILKWIIIIMNWSITGITPCNTKTHFATQQRDTDEPIWQSWDKSTSWYRSDHAVHR